MRMLLLAFALMAALAPAAASADSKCRYQRITELPIWIEHGLPVTVGYLNGRRVGILIDTGSGASFVERMALERLGVPGFREVSLRPFAADDAAVGHTVQIQEFRLGGTVRKDWRVLVSPEDSFGSDIAISLGQDFFRNVDVEFDFADAAVRLYQAENCAQARLSYWSDERTNELAIERTAQLRLTLQVNGQPVRAQLDTGASRSVIDSRTAARLGVTRRSPGAVEAGCTAGLGRDPIDTWIGRFETVVIGEERIQNAKIRFGELTHGTLGRPAKIALQRLPEMLLGMDFLRAHRVLVAHSQGRMYFTYSGGKVFPPELHASCGTRS